MSFDISRLKRIKDYVQIGLTVVMSAVNVWLSSESITQTIGVVYNFGNVLYNPALGIIEQEGVNFHRCTMKVSSPLTNLRHNITINNVFHNIDPRYICRWDPGSLYYDSLCFEQFDCYPLKLMRDIDIVCSSLFLIGFVLIGVLWLLRPPGRRSRVFLWILSTVVLCISFGVSKLSSGYLREMEEEDILRKIETIVVNQGSLEIKFDVAVSKYDLKTTFSEVIFDICSGMALGLIANSAKFLKPPKRKNPDSPRDNPTTEEELRERFL